MDGARIPGWEGSQGPVPEQYGDPHVYARDIQSGAGNCVCGTDLGGWVHVQAAPGVEIPDRLRPAAPDDNPLIIDLGEPLLLDVEVEKAVEEQRFLLTFAYQAGPDPRIAKGADGFRDFFSSVELEKAAWSFLRNGPVGGLFHADGTTGHVEIVESSIHRADPWVIKAVDGSEVTVNPGDWIVGLICDETAWDLYKRGLVGGVSLQGAAKRRQPQAITGGSES